MSLRQNGLLLVLLAALIAIAGDWGADAVLERWWRAPLGLLLLGLAYELALSRRAQLRLQLSAAARWLLCRATPIHLELNSRLPRRLTVEVAVNGPADIALERSARAVELSAGGHGSMSLAAVGRRLGRFEWPKLRVRQGGVLGLAWWNTTLSPAFRLQVVPDVLRDAERALDGVVGGGRPAARVGAGGEVLQLRDYRSGDAPRVIDWKASARIRRLISRDFAEDQHLEIIIALDVSRASGLAAGGSDRLALYVNIAARLAQRAVLLDDRVGVLLYADAPLAALPPGRGDAAVMAMRALLGQATVRPTESNPVLAAMRIRALARRRSIVLLLTDLDDAAMASTLLAAVRLLSPKHLPFIASVSSETAQAWARRPAQDELDVYQAIAAQRYCAGLSRAARALRTAGAACVLAPPAALDTAVLEAYLDLRRRRRV